MTKKSSPKPSTTFREAMPRLAKDRNGANILMCPFCPEPHPILPFTPSACGTAIEFKAIQKIYEGKYNKEMVCAKCHEGGGKMALINGVFFHIHDCLPGVITLTEEPKFSNLAKVVYKMGDGKIKDAIQRRFGRAAIVEEVNPHGDKTGAVLGYFFHRRTNAQYPQTSPAE